MTDTSGPAFPSIIQGRPGEWATAHPGMSLRAYIAIQAMAATMSSSELAWGGCSSKEDMVEYSCKAADALLAELSKEGK